MMNRILIVGDDHHNTLGVIESFAEKGLKSDVIILSKHKHSYVLKSKNVERGWLFHRDADVLECMCENFRDSENKTIVIATNDICAVLLDDNYGLLSEFFILPNTNNPGRLSATISKENMSGLARSVGMDVPKTWVVNDANIPEDIEYPCITKAISSVAGSKSNILICQTEQELRQFLSAQNHCPTIQVQKFVDKEYEFQLLGCSLGYGKEILIPGRTNIIRPNGIDNTFFLKFDRIEKRLEPLVANVRTFIEKTGFQGPFSVEFLHDKNGKDYFTEMNFRNDGNAFCVTKAGFNVPYIYYLYNAGGDYKSEIQNSTVKTTYLNPEVSYFSNFLSGEVGFREWFNNLRKTTCCTTLFKNDVKPFGWFLINGLKHTLEKKFRADGDN